MSAITNTYTKLLTFYRTTLMLSGSLRYTESLTPQRTTRFLSA